MVSCNVGERERDGANAVTWNVSTHLGRDPKEASAATAIPLFSLARALFPQLLFSSLSIAVVSLQSSSSSSSALPPAVRPFYRALHHKSRNNKTMQTEEWPASLSI